MNESFKSEIPVDEIRPSPLYQMMSIHPEKNFGLNNIIPVVLFILPDFHKLLMFK
jgi:hypothetical protein